MDIDLSLTFVCRYICPTSLLLPLFLGIKSYRLYFTGPYPPPKTPTPPPPPPPPHPQKPPPTQQKTHTLSPVLKPNGRFPLLTPFFHYVLGFFFLFFSGFFWFLYLFLCVLFFSFSFVDTSHTRTLRPTMWFVSGCPVGTLLRGRCGRGRKHAGYDTPPPPGWAQVLPLPTFRPPPPPPLLRARLEEEVEYFTTFVHPFSPFPPLPTSPQSCILSHEKFVFFFVSYLFVFREIPVFFFFLVFVVRP